MLSHNDLKKGVQFILEGEPYEVLESSFTYKARGSSTVQAKVRNLKSGNIITRTFHTGEDLREAELTKFQAKYLYGHRGKFVFCYVDNPSSRFEFSEEQVGETARFLKPNQEVEGIMFQEQIINIVPPIKVELKVTDAPPGVKGDRAQGGNKSATLETGVVVNVPLFVETGDIIEINTETGEYVRRIEKGE